jgi:hypothetical protein
MLSERIAKLHAQVGLGVLADRGRRALPEAMREFDAGLRDAKARATGAELRDNYVLLGLLWTDYRAWARSPDARQRKKIAERARRWRGSPRRARASCTSPGARAPEGSRWTRRMPPPSRSGSRACT